MSDLITIASDHIQPFYKKMNTLNRKAKRWGLPAIKTEKVSEGTQVRRIWAEGIEVGKFPVAVTTFKFLGLESFQVDGWRLGGTVEYINHTETIINRNPESVGTVPKFYFGRESVGICEHCNTNRQRKNVFLVQNIETGEFKQVGKSCLKEFISEDSLRKFEFVADIAQFVESDHAGMFGQLPRQACLFSPERIIASALFIIRNFGYVSISKAEGKMPTASRVEYALMPEPDSIPEPPIEADFASAETIVKWGASIPSTDADDYMDKLGKLLRSSHLPARHFGMVVSAVATYNREIAENERKALLSPVVEGKALIVAGRVMSLKEHWSEYGCTMKMVVECEGGYRLWGSVPKAISPNIGDGVEFVANIQKSDKDESFGFFQRPRKASIIG